MTALFDSIGTDGFEFVEFTSPTPEPVARALKAVGFAAVARHRSKNVVRYVQSGIAFCVNDVAWRHGQARAAHGRTTRLGE
jgi:4-hydroxyphenylpyruvate dioxygenase